MSSIADALGVRADQVSITSGGTPAVALAVQAALDAQNRRHVVTTAVEHAAVLDTLAALQDRGACAVAIVEPGPDGQVVPVAIERAMTPDTGLVTVTSASNETGVLQPIDSICHIAHRGGALFHTDAVQTLGRIAIDWHATKVDFASFSAHKIGAVGGLGFVYHRRSGFAEAFRRPRPADMSDFNLPGLASTACAMRERHRSMASELRDRFEAALRVLPNIEVVGGSVARLPNTSLIRFEGCEGDGLLMMLDVEGIEVSTGSACASGSVEPSPVLLSMGYSAKQALEAVRFSWEPGFHLAEVEAVAQRVVDAVERCRALA